MLYPELKCASARRIRSSLSKQSDTSSPLIDNAARRSRLGMRLMASAVKGGAALLRAPLELAASSFCRDLRTAARISGAERPPGP